MKPPSTNHPLYDLDQQEKTVLLLGGGSAPFTAAIARSSSEEMSQSSFAKLLYCVERSRSLDGGFPKKRLKKVFPMDEIDI